MKPVPSPHVKSFMPLVLWRDDVEKIVAILGRGGEDVEIVASEISFENVSELIVHFGVIHPLANLEIVGKKPYTRVALDRSNARLYVSADEKDSSGFF